MEKFLCLIYVGGKFVYQLYRSCKYIQIHIGNKIWSWVNFSSCYIVPIKVYIATAFACAFAATMNGAIKWNKIRKEETFSNVNS